MNPAPSASPQQDELNNILFRRQQLQNRLQFLKEIQRKNNRIDGSHASEEGPSEVERIEDELNDLEEKEKELLKNKKAVQAPNKPVQTTEAGSDGQDPSMQAFYVLPFSPTETISNYILVEEEEPEPVKEQPIPSEPVKEQPESSKPDCPEKTIDLEDLGLGPATVKCPSCQKVGITEIHYKLGSNAFMFCCLISVVGCVAGCCLVPFCMKRFKDVSHRCSSCNKNICTVGKI